MKCSCGGELRQYRTEEKEDYIIRNRKCTGCGRKMTTKECDIAMLDYQLWWIRRFMVMYQEYENKDWESRGTSILKKEE